MNLFISGWMPDPKHAGADMFTLSVNPCRQSPSCELLESRRLLAAGDPDPAFGFAGQATLSFPGGALIVSDVALQSDGKVIVAGSKGGNMAVTRLNVNGTVDTT